jgi:type VI protein secretion system component Hcp
MDDTQTTILMKFETESGPIRAECSLTINDGDLLAIRPTRMNVTRDEVPGFRQVQPGQLPRYFLLQSFTLSAKLGDDESKDDEATAKTTPGAGSRKGDTPARSLHGHQHQPKSGTGSEQPAAGSGEPQPAPLSPPSASSFQSWRYMEEDLTRPPSKKPKNADDQLYKSHLEQFTFSRPIDCATSTLLKACFDGTSFKSASLIKRQAARGSSDKETADLTFLRIDFTGVKITSLTFSDGDVITESCTFTCDAMQIVYAQQDADGRMTTTLPVCWQNPSATTVGRSNA